jgi:hypothetical protein
MRAPRPPPFEPLIARAGYSYVTFVHRNLSRPSLFTQIGVLLVLPPSAKGSRDPAARCSAGGVFA